jgi:hypothetical protein
LDIVRYLEDGFATRDLTEDGLVDRQSALWEQFVEVFEDAKMVEGIQYVQDLTGEDLSTILDDYANDYYDLQMVASHQQDSRQYHLTIPPQWASKEVQNAAKWISQQRILQSGSIPELLPFDHHQDNMTDLNALAQDQQDEMLTQASLLAASTTANHLDLVKDTTIIDTLRPYIQFEQNVLNMVQTSNAIIFKNIFDKQSILMEQLRNYRPSLEVEMEILRQFDKDALDRFNTMHVMHKNLMNAYAQGAASRVQLFQQTRDNVIDMYLEWVNSPVSQLYNNERDNPQIASRMATEVKIEGQIRQMGIEINSMIARDENTASARDAYLKNTENERSQQLDELYGALLRTKKNLTKVIDDEFTKLDMFMTEIDLADKEFALYLDKVEGLKLEWDRYSLLTKAAVIKAIVLQGDGDNIEADELLESTNKAVLNMEYLKKVIHVIGADLEAVANVAGKRVHNQYTHFDPSLVQYQAKGDRTDIQYPVPEPYILSPNIIIPENRQYFHSDDSQGQEGPDFGSEYDGLGFTPGNMSLDPSKSNPQYGKHRETHQDRLQQAYLQDPLAPRLDPNLPWLPEDYEGLENMSFAERVPTHINPGTGVGQWEGAFKSFLGTNSAYAAQRTHVGGSGDVGAIFGEKKNELVGMLKGIHNELQGRGFFGLKNDSHTANETNHFHFSALPTTTLTKLQHSVQLQLVELIERHNGIQTIYSTDNQLDIQDNLIFPEPLAQQPEANCQQFSYLPDTSLVRQSNGFALLEKHGNGSLIQLQNNNSHSLNQNKHANMQSSTSTRFAFSVMDQFSKEPTLFDV